MGPQAVYTGSRQQGQEVEEARGEHGQQAMESGEHEGEEADNEDMDVDGAEEVLNPEL